MDAVTSISAPALHGFDKGCDLPGIQPWQFTKIESDLAFRLAALDPNNTDAIWSLSKAEKLLEKISLKKFRKGQTMLMTASRTGHVEIMRSFLFHPMSDVGDMDTEDENGWTALMYAAQGGHAGAVFLLIQANASINHSSATDLTPLHVAASGVHFTTSRKRSANYCKVIQLLLGAGANINAQDVSGCSPLHAACENKRSHAIFLLLRSGADFRLKTSEDDSVTTAMHMVCEYSDPHFGCDILSVLCALGADALTTDQDGKRAIHLIVAQQGCDGMLQTLHSFFPDMDFSPRNNAGETPLHCINEDNLEMFEYLLKHGADISASDNNGDTPLHIFAAKDDSDTVKCMEKLLLKGASMTAKNITGYDAMMEAEENDNQDAVFLLENEVCAKTHCSQIDDVYSPLPSA